MKNLNIISILSILLITGCSKNDNNEVEITNYNTINSDTVEIQHFNVIFAADLSNRIIPKLNPKPVDDIQIITDFFENTELILNYKRSTDQFDKFSFDLVNKNLISKFNIDPDLMKIDFSKFGTNQMERIQYLKNTGEKKLKDDLKIFTTELIKTYESAKRENNGADLYAYLENFNELNLERGPKPFVYQKVTYKSVFKNTLVLLTDGYIEAGFYGKDACKGNLCYYLSSNRIKEFRESYIKSGYSSKEEFFEKEGYGIVPLQNKVLKDFEILVLEVNDRSLNSAGNTTVKPSDFEIIKLFWEDWFKKSGIKDYKIVPITISRENSRKEILSFLGISISQ